MTGVNYNAEIWNPTTGQWLVGPAQAKARLYHSTAVLLPDASVLVRRRRSARARRSTPTWRSTIRPTSTAQRAGFATRPVIEAAPGTIEIGETFGVDIERHGAISRIALVKSASVSHSWNMEQRFVELTFQQNGGQLTIQAPTRAGDAPPGYYLLFALNAAGTPSVAKIVKIRGRGESQSGDHAEPRESRATSRARPARRTACNSRPRIRMAMRSRSVRAACRLASSWTPRPARSAARRRPRALSTSSRLRATA